MGLFDFLKKANPAAPAVTSAPVRLPLPSELSDEQLIAMLAKTLDHPRTCSLFLVAVCNCAVQRQLVLWAIRKDGREPQPEDDVRFFIDGYSRHRDSSDTDPASRRFFYLYLACLLDAAHARYAANQALGDSLAALWIQLLEGAAIVRKTIDDTSVWDSEHTAYLDDVRTADEGIDYYLALHVPPSLRYHRRIEDWRDA